MAELLGALVALWAKTDRQRGGARHYHPLPCHLLDVAMVTRVMWDEVLTLALRRRLAAGLGIDEESAGHWTVFLAGLHDIGKCSPVFQAKDPVACERLRAVGLEWSWLEDDPGHGTIGTVVIEAYLRDVANVSMNIAETLATAIGGHHGAFPSTRRVASASSRFRMGGPPWDAARRAIIEALASLTQVPVERPPWQCSHATAMILAGLVSVADWIGSDESYFPFAGDGYFVRDEDWVAYRARAEAQARCALTALGWFGWIAPDAPATLHELFPFISEPRPAQSAIVALPGIIEAPGIVIVELPMGEGKTEAALLLADAWTANLGQSGLYLAMPTMATSNQMFGRVREVLERRYPNGRTNMQLLHGRAAIAAELEALRARDETLPVMPAGIYGDAGADNAPATVIAAEWFTRRKRGLLAPFAVGTVDQSLLAALQTRHVFVRVFGLAGKTIVFDEVHAYDLYMTTLFERLLEWLGALGSPVIVLSATLPSERRKALLSAYARGADRPIAGDVPDATYPRLSWLGAKGAGARSVGVSDQSRRALAIEWVDGTLPADPGQPFPLGEQLRSALHHGGCAAVICNTVARAQDTYEALKRYFADEELSLLHARFPFAERDSCEKDALIAFGKPGGMVATDSGEEPVRRPPRAVLVSTQIIEQSLDLDFDLMVTDLAPADLVLQRSGRLHRHDRRGQRPTGNAPELWILAPPVAAGVPRFDRGAASVYDEHVLLRSWLALRQYGSIAVPDDVEGIIEAVYDPSRECPPDAGEELRAFWSTTLAKWQKDAAEAQAMAKDRCIAAPAAPVALWRITEQPREEDAPEIHQALQALTRLTRPTVTVACLWQTDAGVALDPEGLQPINLDASPPLTQAKEVLAQTASLADPRIVHTLLQREPPKGWRASALLRHHRALVFDADRCAPVTGTNYRIRRDRELGLVVEEDA